MKELITESHCDTGEKVEKCEEKVDDVRVDVEIFNDDML